MCRRLATLLVLASAVVACAEQMNAPAPEPPLPAAVTPELARLLSEVDTLPHDEVRRQSEAALAADPDVATGLVAVLRSDEMTRAQRGRAVVVIGSLGPPMLPPLLDFFLASDETVAQRAYVAIRHVLPAASTWIDAEPFPLAHELTDGHTAALATYEAPLLDRARHASGHQRRYAVLILAAFPPGARTAASIPVLTDAVMHDDAAMANDASCALIASADVADDAVPRLLRVLDGTDEDAREMALSILERIGKHASSVAPAFLERAEDTTDAELRCSLLVAVSAMGTHGKGAVPLLARELSTDDLERMRSAASCLIAIGADAVPALVTALDSGSPEARVIAAVSLGRLADRITPAGRAALARHADAEDPDLARAVQRALEALPR